MICYIIYFLSIFTFNQFSSGGASAWLSLQDTETKLFYSNPNLTIAELDASVKHNMAIQNFKR